MPWKEFRASDSRWRYGGKNDRRGREGRGELTVRREEVTVRTEEVNDAIVRKEMTVREEKVTVDKEEVTAT